MDTPVKAEWTLVFIIQMLDEDVIQQYTKKFYEDLRELKKSENVNVLLIYNTTIQPIRSSTIDQSAGTPLKRVTHFSEIQNTRRGSRLYLTNTKDEFDPCSEHHLADYFRKVVQDYPANHYLIATWDHATPFSMFKPMGEPLIQDALTITKLRNAITDSFGKVEVLMMNNCFLQTVDTGYELRECVNFLVAFQTLMYLELPTEQVELMMAINANPKITPEAVARLAVSSFIENPERPESKQMALSANDLSKYDELAKALDIFGSDLLKLLDTNPWAIKSAIFECGYLCTNKRHYFLIDLGNFITRLEKYVPEDLFPGTYFSDLKAIIADTVIETYFGRELFQGETPMRPSGISIYLPDYSYSRVSSTDYFTYFVEAPDTATQFMKKFSWKHFVTALSKTYHLN